MSTCMPKGRLALPLLISEDGVRGKFEAESACVMGMMLLLLGNSIVLASRKLVSVKH